jgi:Tfp pilus assembly protein PilN
VIVRINQIRSEKDTFGDAAPIVQKYNEQKESLEKQIKVLESLTENRLREVKLLDAVQSITPPKAWIEHISITNGKASMSGFAPEESAVSGLYRSLEANVLFSNVKVKSEAIESPNVGLVQRFEFSFNAGRVK